MKKISIRNISFYQKKVSNFFHSIEKEDRIAIFHDIDGDGICATALMIKILHRLGLKAHLSIGKGREEISPSQETLDELKDKRITKLIILDKSAEGDIDSINQASIFADTLIIDHHPIMNESLNKTLIIKPQYFSKKRPSKYSTSEMVYNLFSKMLYLEDLDWIAFGGALSDVAAGSSFTKKIMKKYQFKGDPWDSPIGLFVKQVAFSALYGPKARIESVAVLSKAKSYRDVLKSNLRTYYESVNEEMQYHIINFEKNAEFIDDIAMYELNPKYPINTPLATIISVKYYPKKTLILFTHLGNGKMSVSLRRNDFKKSMNKLIKESIKGLFGAHGGGHPAASGARIYEKDLEKLKKRLIKINKRL